MVTGGLNESLYKLLTSNLCQQDAPLIQESVALWLNASSQTQVSSTSLLTLLTLEIPQNILQGESLTKSLENTLMALHQKEKNSWTLLFTSIPSSEIFFKNICTQTLHYLESNTADKIKNEILFLYFVALAVPAMKMFRKNSTDIRGYLPTQDQFTRVFVPSFQAALHQKLRKIFSHDHVQSMISWLQSESSATTSSTTSSAGSSSSFSSSFASFSLETSQSSLDDQWSSSLETKICLFCSLSLLLYQNYHDIHFIFVTKNFAGIILQGLKILDNKNSIHLLASHVLSTKN